MTQRSRRSVRAAALGLAMLGVVIQGCSQSTTERRIVTPHSNGDPEVDTLDASDADEAIAAAEAATAPSTATVPGDVELDALRLEGIKRVADRGQTGIFVKLSRVPTEVKDFTLSSPNRIVLDLYGPVGDGKPIEVAPTADAQVERVRVGYGDGRIRVTLDVKGPLPVYTVNSLDSMVVAFLGERTETAGAASEEVLYARSAAPATGGGLAMAPAVITETPTYEQPRALMQSARPREFTGQKISLDFKDADVQNVLRILAEVGDVNIVATDDVKGRITLRLVDVPWDQALDIVLQAARLDMVREGNVIRVSSVTRIKEEREAALAADQAARELEPLKTAYIRVNYLKVTGRDEQRTEIQSQALGDAQQVCQGGGRGRGGSQDGDPIKDQVQKVISERGEVTIDARTNTIIVRDIQRGIEAARELVAQLDIPTPQVLIESNIVEASDVAARDLGIQWGYAYGVGPQFGTSTGKNFPGSVLLGGSGLGTGAAPGTGGAATQAPGGGTAAGPTLGTTGIPAQAVPFIVDFPADVSAGAGSAFNFALGSIDGSKALAARITALESDGKVKIVSRPKVATSNNELACIASVLITRVRTPDTGVTVGGAAAGAFEEFITGIVLNVVPQVSADGYILMQLRVVSSSAGPDAVDDIPTTLSREAATTVLIKSGETLVLGGVFRDTEVSNEAGVPFLRNIPFFGWLFKTLARGEEREELIVFLTPKVIESSIGNPAFLPNAGQLWSNRPQG